MDRLVDYRVFTFDCYGTLIDWETGIWDALASWRARTGIDVDRTRLLEAFARHESALEAEAPVKRYPEVLAAVHHRLATEWGVDCTEAEAGQFGASVGSWPAFPDSAEALAYLKRHHMLVILSNVDNDSFRASNAKLGVEFDAVFTAQDIGSYKPDLRNFEYLIEALAHRGVRHSDILHSAQSVFHDLIPASRVGLATNWIDRRHSQPGWGATPGSSEKLRIDFHHTSMADFVRHHEAALRGT